MKRCFFVFLLFCFSCQAQVKDYKLSVVKSFPHDREAYTQGLFFHNGELYESTGQYGESTLRKVSLEDGKVIEKVKFASKYFAEGSVFFKDKIYILTWTNKVAFVYGADFKYIKSYSYPKEGWGLTTDGESLIASDGSSKIYYLDENLKTIKTLSVTYNGRPLRLLNELEWIDGKIWANVYLTDMIVIINPSTGKVEGRIDCTGLLDAKLRDSNTDVLNGIAYNSETKKIYLTGKNWPRLFEVKVK